MNTIKIILILFFLIAFINVVDATEIGMNDTLQYQNNTEVSTTLESYVKVKEIIVNDSYTGSWRITFDLRCPVGDCSVSGNTARGKVYINDIAYGSEQITPVFESDTKSTSENFSSISINNGDKIELYLRSDTNNMIVYASNFQIKFKLNNLSTIPNISSPINNSRQYNNSINFTWNASTDLNNDSITYNWQMAENSVFTTNLTKGNTSNLYTGNQTTVEGKTYYLRVRSYDTYSYSNWSNVTQFTENSIPIPSLITHANFHSLSNLTVNWTNVTDSEADTITYDVKVYNTTTGTLVVNQSSISTNYSQAFTPANFTNYNFTVRSYDTYEYSNWSAASTFGFTNTAPVYNNITLSPSTPTSLQNLTAIFNYTDADGDTVTKNYTLWYKDSVLQTSLNNTLIVVASGNTSNGQHWYYEVFGNDGYNNSTVIQSNEVIIGTTNSAPNFTALTLIPNNKKYNQPININVSGILDDSTSWQVQSYYKFANLTKSYLGNSTWQNTSFINYSVTIPWSDGGLHTIYSVVYDSGNATGQDNLSSSETSVSFTSNITNPTVESSSVSASSISTGGSVIISVQFNGIGANISSAKVNVRRPDATNANYTLNCGSGEIVNCTYVYDSTSDVGNYYVDYFYPTDTAGLTPQIASALTWSASTPVVVVPPSSGGGGGSTTIITQPTDNLSGILVKIQNVSSELPPELAGLISECYTRNVLLEGKCTSTFVLTDPFNFWPIIVGVFIGAFFMIFGIAIIFKIPKNLIVDTFLYGTISLVVTQVFVVIGFNVYLFNYLFQSNLPGFMFASTVMWSMVITYFGDSIISKKK